MKKIQRFIKEQPLYAFLIGVVAVTVILGIAAFASTRGPSEKSDTVAEEETLTDADTDTESVEQDEEPVEEEVVEEEEEPTPKKKATPTEEPDEEETATPSPAPTAEEKRYNYNFLGDVFEDANCNGTRDSGEGAVTKSMTINLFKMPDSSAFESVKTDSTGHYSYNSSLKDGDKISLKAEAVAPDGYKLYPKFSSETFEFSSSKASQGQNIPLVPSDKLSSCPAS